MIPIIVGKLAGQQKLLRNRSLNDIEISPALAEGLHKTLGEPLTPEQAVARIIADVRARGDAALLDWTRQLDGVTLPSVAVSQDEIDAAYAETPAAVRDAIEFAAARVRAFHEKQKPKSWLAGRGEAFARLGAELKRGFQFKEDADAPAMTKSMHIALKDLKLRRLWVVYPGAHRFPMAERIEALPLAQALKLDAVKE